MTNHAAQLLKLSDTDLIIANPAEDIRGRTARDVDGEKIGKIEDLLVDSEDNQVRLLRLEHGGILGFGATPSFVPVEAITDDDVHLRQAGAKVAQAPRYDPELSDASDFYGQVYGYYGSALRHTGRGLRLALPHGRHPRHGHVLTARQNIGRSDRPESAVRYPPSPAAR